MTTTPLDWRLLVVDRYGQNPRTFTPEHHIQSLGPFSIDRYGSCGEGAFTAIPAHIDIRPRDRVTFQVSRNFGLTWQYIYTGDVVIAGNPRSLEPQTFQLVGLKQRIYQRAMRMAKISGGDVASMVHAASADLPRGVLFSFDAVPLQTFTQGDRYPNFETVGDFLDAMAASVPGFIVPPGSGPYTYDGKVFGETMEVPETAWGVNAFGGFFFRRMVDDPLIVRLNEALPDVTVDWNEVGSEDPVDRVWLVYGTAFDLTLVNDSIVVVSGSGTSFNRTPAAKPLALYEGVTTEPSDPLDYRHYSTIAHTLENPLDYMERVSLIRTTQGGNWQNSANATDGDSNSYAHIPSNPLVGTQIMTLRSNTPLGIWRIRYHVSNYELPVIARIHDASGNFSEVEYRLEKIDGGDTPHEVWLLSTPIAEFDTADPLETATLEIQLGKASDIVTGATQRIYEVEFFTPDLDLAPYIVQSLKSAPPGEVAQASGPGITPRADRLYITARDATSVFDATVDVPIVRTEYMVTVEDGARTVYHAGQPFRAKLLTERVLLERLARREVKPIRVK